MSDTDDKRPADDTSPSELPDYDDISVEELIETGGSNCFGTLGSATCPVSFGTAGCAT